MLGWMSIRNSTHFVVIVMIQVRLNINRQYHQITNLFLNIWNRFVQDMQVRLHLFVDTRQDVWVMTQEEFADDVIRAAMVLQSMPEELRRVAVEQVRILNGLTFN